MNTNDLKKRSPQKFLLGTGIIATIITFAVLFAWFGFAKISLGAYNEKNLTRQFLAEDSAVFKTIVIEVGTDTVARIIVGTSSMTRTGTSSYPYQPRIQYSHVTGLWSFKNSGGTETVAFGTVSASYVAAEIGSNSANYVLKNDGSSTGQLATDATLAGSITIGTDSTITTGTSTFSGTKVGYLADVESPIGADITSKLTRIGTPTTYLNSVIADGKTGTSSFSLAGGSNITFTSVLNPDGSLAITADTSGSATAKSGVQEGGTVTAANASHINFDNTDFDTAVDGTGASIALSELRKVDVTSYDYYIFGNGTDTLTVNTGSTTIVNGTAYYRTVTIESGGTLTCAAQRVLSLYVSGTLTVNGALSVDGKGLPGTTTSYGTSTISQGLVYSGLPGTGGGGGGGCTGAGTGGAGGNATGLTGGTGGSNSGAEASAGINGVSVVPISNKDNIVLWQQLINDYYLDRIGWGVEPGFGIGGYGGGSGGQAGPATAQPGGVATIGGYGGGCLRIFAAQVSNNNRISAAGLSGQNGLKGTGDGYPRAGGSSGGAGGGSGGIIDITTKNISGTGTISTAGGLGGVGTSGATGGSATGGTSGSGSTGAPGLYRLRLLN